MPGGIGEEDFLTLVLPYVKTAREEVRQARRTGQAVKGVGAEDVAARDKADSKAVAYSKNIT